YPGASRNFQRFVDQGLLRTEAEVRAPKAIFARTNHRELLRWDLWQEGWSGCDNRDFHRIWDIRIFMHLDRDDKSSPAGRLIQVRAQLQQKQPGRFGLLPALRDLGITSNLL